MGFQSIVYTIIALPILFGILVIVHEWGHFIVARLCGIRVDEFSLGFGPLAYTFGKRGDTQYNIRWIPMGGFVKIAGMEPDEEPLIRAAEKVRGAAGKQPGDNGEPADASQAADKSGLSITDLPFLAENTPDLNETPEQRLRDETEGFYAHPLWQRALVIFAGPFMSFVLGYVTFIIVIIALGLPGKPLPVVGELVPDSQAQKIGMLPHDRIFQVNGVNVSSFDQIVTTIHGSINKPVTLSIHRGDQTLTLTGTPQATPQDGKIVGTLGFVPDFTYVRPPIGEIIPATNKLTGLWFSTMVGLIRQHNIHEIKKSIGGPIFIVKATHEAVQAGGPDLPALMGQLSMSLALFNLLPIPILDGGHLLLFLVEGLRRGKRLSVEQQQSYMLAGLAIIGTLFVFIMFNDITRR